MNSKLDPDDLSSKPICLHKFVSYIGRQSTLDPDKYIYLYNCDICHTTIAFPSKLQPWRPKL